MYNIFYFRAILEIDPLLSPSPSLETVLFEIHKVKATATTMENYLFFGETLGCVVWFGKIHEIDVFAQTGISEFVAVV